MLPKNERLKSNKDFQKVFKLKCSIGTPILVAYFMSKQDHSESNFPKVGFVVSKKVHKRAVKRNRIKRQMREIYRIIKADKPELITHFDSIIFISRPNVYGKEFLQIHKSMINCLQRGQKFVKTEAC